VSHTADGYSQMRSHWKEPEFIYENIKLHSRASAIMKTRWVIPVGSDTVSPAIFMSNKLKLEPQSLTEYYTFPSAGFLRELTTGFFYDLTKVLSITSGSIFICAIFYICSPTSSTVRKYLPPGTARISAGVASFGISQVPSLVFLCTNMIRVAWVWNKSLRLLESCESE